MTAATGSDTTLAPRPAQAPARWADVARQVAGAPLNRVVFALSMVVVGLGYSILLPFDFTQRISWANWAYDGPRYIAYSAAFGAGMAWLVTLQVHAVRRVTTHPGRASRRPGPLGAVAAVLSILPSLLCCSPIVPSFVGLLGLSAATRLRTTGRIQGFFATRQDPIMLAGLAVLVGAGAWSMRKVVRASCLDEEGCAPPGRPGHHVDPIPDARGAAELSRREKAPR